MPCGRQRRSQRRVGNHRIQTRGQPFGILKVSQQTSLSVPDQMYRTFTSGGHDGPMRCPGFDNDIAEPLDPAGANQNIRCGQESGRIIPPAKKDDARGDTKLFGQRPQRSLFGPVPAIKRYASGTGKSVDQDIESLVPVQPAKTNSNGASSGVPKTRRSSTRPGPAVTKFGR